MRISSNSVALDSLLGHNNGSSGLCLGDSLHLVGPSGAGKTRMALSLLVSFIISTSRPLDSSLQQSNSTPFNLNDGDYDNDNDNDMQEALVIDTQGAWSASLIASALASRFHCLNIEIDKETIANACKRIRILYTPSSASFLAICKKLSSSDGSNNTRSNSLLGSRTRLVIIDSVSNLIQPVLTPNLTSRTRFYSTHFSTIPRSVCLITTSHTSTSAYNTTTGLSSTFESPDSRFLFVPAMMPDPLPPPKSNAHHHHQQRHHYNILLYRSSRSGRFHACSLSDHSTPAVRILMQPDGICDDSW